MCNCKDCKGITLLSGNDGKGIVSITYNEENSTITVLYTDGTTYTSPAIGCGCTEVVGSGNIVSTPSPNPSGGTIYTISQTAKQFLYQETISTLDISLDPSFSSLVYFQPVGYTNLTYTNTTSSTKTYKVHASYEFAIGDVTPNNAGFGSWVDAAIVRNTTPVYEVSGQLNISSFLFWGPNSADLIGSGSPLHLLLDNQGSNVDVRFVSGNIPLNSAFFKVVTLAPGESISMRFRTKDPTPPGLPALALLRKAQLMVDEV